MTLMNLRVAGIYRNLHNPPNERAQLLGVFEWKTVIVTY